MSGPWERDWGQAAQPAPERAGPWSRYAAQGPSSDEGVIFEDGEGGRVIRRDGRLMFTSPAYSTTDPDRIAQIMEGATGAEAYRGGVQEQMIADRPVAARAATAFSGVPFVGSYGDEAASAVWGPQAGQAWRAGVEAMDERRPGQALGLRAAGTAASIPALIAAAPQGAIMEGRTRGARMVAAGLAGALGGATEGAIYGAGMQEGDGRTTNAVTNAAIGGGLGGMLGGALPPVQDGIRWLASRFRGRPAQELAEQLGVSTGAATVIRAALEAGDLQAAEAALRRAGGGAMLADAGQPARELLDASATAGGGAGRIAREAVDDRVAERYQGLTDALDATLGTPVGRDTARGVIRTGTAAERGALYDAAYAQPIDYSADAGRRVEALLRRVSPEAIRAAERLMRTEGVESAQIMARIGDDGSVTFTRMPDVRQLHYIMRGLGEAANREQGAGALGGTSDVGRATEGLRRALGRAVSDAVPEFGAAQARFAEIASESRAIETGYGLLRPGTTREQVARALDSASPAELAAARQGVRDYIEDQVASVRRIASDPNQDAREALAAMRLMTSRRAEANLRAVLGRDEAETLFGALEETIAALELRAAIAANSRTAIRGSIQDAVREVNPVGVLEYLMDGSPIEAGRRAVRMVTGSSEEARALRDVGIFEEITRALTATRGPQAQQALRILQDAQRAGGVISDGRAEYLGRVLSRTFAVQGHQEALRSLEAR